MITYLIGDATFPQGEGNKIIAHICNDIGAWGAGFVLAISKRWSKPKEDYRKWYKEASLGDIQLVKVEKDIWVANMIGQAGIHSYKGNPPIRYWAVRSCLEKLSIEAKKLNSTIHMPLIGAGLASGNWETIEGIIKVSLFDSNVYIYKLK